MAECEQDPLYKTYQCIISKYCTLLCWILRFSSYPRNISIPRVVINLISNTVKMCNYYRPTESRSTVEHSKKVQLL